jgi:hypothetical protein
MSDEQDDPERMRQLQESLDRMSSDELRGVCDYLREKSGQRAPTQNWAREATSGNRAEFRKWVD